MNKLNISNIDFGKIRTEIERHENKWIAISDRNSIVSSGDTFDEAIEKAEGKKNIVLFKVPSLSASLAPGTQ